MVVGLDLAENIEFPGRIGRNQFSNANILIRRYFCKGGNETDSHIGSDQGELSRKGIHPGNGLERLHKGLVVVDFPDHVHASVIHGDDGLAPQLLPVQIGIGRKWVVPGKDEAPVLLPQQLFHIGFFTDGRQELVAGQDDVQISPDKMFQFALQDTF